MSTKVTLISLFFFCQFSFLMGQQWIYKGTEKSRAIVDGKGQEFDRKFFSTGDMHFVQFAVYPSRDGLDPFSLGAPNVGQVWIIYHRDTQVEGRKFGAFYIVKPFPNGDAARKAVANIKKKGIECWYNKDLTNVTFDLVGMTMDEQ